MEAIEPNLFALVLFALTWAVFCVGAIQVAGMLPLSAAPEAVRTPDGVALVIANVLLLAAVLILTCAYGYNELRWTSSIVVGGMIFLLAPFLIQDLPENLKNGKAGLLILFVLSLAALGLLHSGGATDFLTGPLIR